MPEVQLSLFDPEDLPCGKTFPELCPRPRPMGVKEQLSKSSSRSLSASSMKKRRLSLCLKTDGPTKERLYLTMDAVPLLGESSTLSFPAFRNGEGVLLFCATTMAYLPVKSCLSNILVADAPSRYNLSPRACQGIINRAGNRGKQLPEVLLKALTQIAETACESPAL